MNAAAMSDREALSKFAAAMAEAGLRNSDDIIGDGQLQRFYVEGDPKGTRNGWYVLFLDTDATFKYPAGEFGCWKRGIQVSWCARSEKELTPQEHHEIRARIEKAREERAALEREKHEAVAKIAHRIWDAAQDQHVDQHAYLVRKGVKSYGLRVGKWQNGTECLLVPVMDATGKLVSLQGIFQNVSPTIGRDKDFLKGGKKRGCWFPIGSQPPGGKGVILLCEGYATGASLHEATGLHVAVAFDAGNLKPVAYELRRRWPACTIVVAADNDRWTAPTPENPHVMENPGVTQARAVHAALPSRTVVAIPEFKNLDDRPTDYNDLHKREGIATVRAQIYAAIPESERGAANDNEAELLPLGAVIPSFMFPDISEKGQLLNTVENLKFLFEKYGITVRYNITRKYVEVKLPGREYGEDLDANCALAEINSICARNRMPKSDTPDYIKLISAQFRYNPVEDFIRSIPWDGKSRFADLCDTLHTPGDFDPALKALLLRKWLISAAAAALKPRGFWSKGVLVLQGAQSEGKTSWIKALLPPDLRQLLKVGATIDPANKDSVSSVISHWLVELGELDGTFRKADIARLKGFISQDIDQLRRPYDRLESEYQRRTVFFASVNPKVFLVDDTGNVRWWTIPVLSVNVEHGIDVQQLWAEAAHYYDQGERWWLEKDEESRLEQTNADHQEPNTIEEMILTKFDWQKPRTRSMTCTEVLIAIGFDTPKNSQAKDAGMILRRLTKGEPKKSNGKIVFMLPPEMGSHYNGSGPW